MIIPRSLYPVDLRTKVRPTKLIIEQETPALPNINKRERPRSVGSTPGPTPSAKKTKFVFPPPEVQEDSEEEDEEINVDFTFMERRGAVKVTLSSRIRIDQKWISPDKLLTDVVSECLKNEEYFSTDLTDEKAERLSNNLKDGNALIVRAEVANSREDSPPASPETPEDESE